MKDTKINELYNESTENMSKRFYAACKAMQAMLDEKYEPNNNFIRTIVKDAYKIADEMLKQENQTS